MSGKVSKKGRNPGAVDNWLDSIGLYRKNVAYDETCLFRAVSEQLFDCQIYHERVRKECVDYGRKNYCEFWHILDSEEEWYDHMDLLEKHMVVCGNIEIQIISMKYNRDVLVFDASRQQLFDLTKRSTEKTLMLCLMGEDHYDVVYRKDHIQDAGFCQSMVYSMLYEDVFKISKVQDIVHGMLYEKEFVAPPALEVNNNLDTKSESEEGQGTDTKNVTFGSSQTNVAPFPFKVAKALDPSIYRNIEYDSWTEVRRELRLGDWYYGDDNLILGTRCILNENDETYECYIQDIIKSQNKCVVYVTKLAQKRTVNYTDLSPENDAKPWPLPYRFTKNLCVTTTSQSQTTDKNVKSPKKRKDKRRFKSNSESSIHVATTNHQSERTEHNIKAYVGVPLQMQNNTSGNHNNYLPQQESPQEPPEVSLSQHNLLVTPEVASPMPKFTWEAPWNNYVPSTPDPVMWSHAPQGMYNGYTMKPFVASAPVTPDVVPYHDYPYVSYPYAYNAWHQPGEYVQHHEPTNQMDTEEVPEQHASEAQGETSSGSVYEQSYERPSTEMTNRPTMSLPPPSPQVEIYSPVIPMAPGTPIIYTTEVGEMMYTAVPPSSVPVYTHTPPVVDVQYMSPGPYIYPPTPPAAWYPSGINSQGFIFPPPVNQK